MEGKELKFMWKPVLGYEQHYEVNTLGQVRSIDRIIKNRRGLVQGKVLKPFLNKKGYPAIRFYIGGKGLERNPHRLVAEAFIPNPKSKLQVNHINGDKTDNRIENLEWCTNSENQLHAYVTGLQPSRKGENNSNAKLTYDVVTEIKTKYNSGMKITDISKEINVNLSILRQLIYGRTWKSHKMEVYKRDERKRA